ncbi:MAG: serine/threonine-protein kinase [Acidobacteriota bacterium]
MSVVFVVDSDSPQRLCQLMQRLPGADVTQTVGRALSFLEESAHDQPLILRHRLTAARAGDLIQRMRWVRPSLKVCLIAKNPLIKEYFSDPETVALTEPLCEDAKARLNELLEIANRKTESVLEARAPMLRFGRYVALEELGSGGEGTTYRGWDPILRRQVALKRSTRTCLASVRRTVWEGRNASSINHPNVIGVLDCIHTDSCDVLVMEYVAGGDLAKKLDEGRRLPRREVYQLGLDIAGALRASHREGLVHGDIKPANVLIDGEGRFKLADYGASGTGYQELQGWFRGTPGYLPPETYFDRSYNQASDVFGLGVLLYRALTGELPFGGSSLVELMEASLMQVVPSCRWADPNSRMSWLLESMMSKCPDQRPSLDATIGVLKSSLRQLDAEETTPQSAQGRPEASRVTGMGRGALPTALLSASAVPSPARDTEQVC